jgi:3-isopropylmalate/(R)-2-methylmalate dehydratase large subunit
MGQTITEKILSRAMGRAVIPGETIYPEPDLITCHDWYVVFFDRALKEFGVDRLYAPKKVLISTDHEPVVTTRQGAERQQAIREIVARYGIERFFDTGRGGHGHVFPMEMGYITPGMFVLAYDPHVTNYGAVGALGIALVVEISEVLACGSVWIRVPQTVRVNLKGRLPAGVAVRDLAQRLTLELDADLVDYCVVEYGGPGLADIGHGGRMTLCNTPLEIGAKSAIVEPDRFTRDWLAGRVKEPLAPVVSDPDAAFKAVIDFDMSTLEPQVAAPPTPDNVVAVGKVAGTPIQHAFVGSCANCSIEDLRDAARILRGRRLHPQVRMIVTPGTQEIAAKAASEGLLEVFITAGASLTAPGCGPCAGGRVGTIGPGETSINTGTRNDPGRLGTGDNGIYLASPLTVAASAVTGKITDPREFL